MEALVAATRHGAETIGIENRLGTLEAGKWADLLILNEDPRWDIGNEALDRVGCDGRNASST